jgi:hypothetical protein
MHAYVRDVMTTGVVAVRTGTPYREMTAMFREHRDHGQVHQLGEDRQPVLVV